MPDNQSQDENKVPISAPPPYEPDEELIGFIERGQRPAKPENGRDHS
jgi:hypothetical protein